MHNRDADLIGSAEAARVCGVDRATFNRWVVAGQIEPRVAMPGRNGIRLFSRADVDVLAGAKVAMPREVRSA